MLRRLAEGVAEAHRVGLAVGGLSPENVVLRPNGLVGLRAVPAATGSIDGDIAALGRPAGGLPHRSGPGDGGARPLTGPSDLRGPRPPRALDRARPGPVERRRHGLAARRAPPHRAGRPATGPAPHRAAPRRHRQRVAAPAPRAPSGRRRRARRPPGRRPRGRGRCRAAGPADDAARCRGAAGAAVRHRGSRAAALGGDTIDAGSVAPRGGRLRRPAGRPAPGRRPDERSWGDPDESFDVLAADGGYGGYGGHRRGDTAETDDEDGARRHRLVVIGLPLLALLVVIALAWWVGSTLLDVTDSVDKVQGSTPSASASGRRLRGAPAAAAGAAVPIVTADGVRPARRRRAGERRPRCRWPTTATPRPPGRRWSTGDRRTSATSRTASACCSTWATSQALSGVTIASTAPGATVEIRTADKPADNLDGFTPAADGTLEKSTDLTLRQAGDGPVRAGLDHRPGAQRRTGSRPTSPRSRSTPRAERGPARPGGSAGTAGECRPYDPRCAARDELPSHPRTRRDDGRDREPRDPAGRARRRP